MNVLHSFIGAGRAASTGTSHCVSAYVITAQRSTSSAFLQVNKYSSVNVWITANSPLLVATGKAEKACAQG